MWDCARSSLVPSITTIVERQTCPCGCAGGGVSARQVRIEKSQVLVGASHRMSVHIVTRIGQRRARIAAADGGIGSGGGWYEQGFHDTVETRLGREQYKADWLRFLRGTSGLENIPPT
jgi:hypothetical protein